MTLALAIAALLFLAAMGYALMPLVLIPAEDSAEAVERDELVLRRERLLGELRDVDMDLEMGKISADDHAELRESLSREAVAVMAELDRLDGEEGSDASDEDAAPSSEDDEASDADDVVAPPSGSDVPDDEVEPVDELRESPGP
ncbi:MAG: hypothetical protein AAF533_11325 [Acidobacteriota bacterium]